MDEQNGSAPQDAQNDSAPEQESSGTIKVFLTSTSETGFCDHVELPAGATLGSLWESQMAGKEPKNYVIRVARTGSETLPASFVLEDGDRVTITPHKFDGARPGFKA